MSNDEVRYEGNCKFVWDGELYPTRDAAQEKNATYEANSFQVCMFEKDGAFRLYTRRVVTEVVVEGQAPA